MSRGRHCANCGNAVASGARFCARCGARLQDDLSPRGGTGRLGANHRLNGNRYLILGKLAQGGQSAVYLAMDAANGQRCVIKELSETQLAPDDRLAAVNDFLREATILIQLRHPGLCRVYDTFFEDNRKPYLVMEYITGHTLEDELMDHGRPLEWLRVGAWGIMLADVLGYLHHQTPPVLHRDVKPANALVTRAGTIKLIDFGFARRLYAPRQITTAYLGTEGFSPLEQYDGRTEPGSDLYALGASLYYLLTGRIPEAAPERCVSGHTLVPIRSLNPTVPEALDRVIQQAMKLDVRERFTDGYRMRQALEWACQHGAQVGAHQYSLRPGTP